MPLSSMQIAQMSGAYQQQALQQMQYAGAIGQQLPRFGGENIMSGAMTTAGAVAGPLAYGGMALAGLDPMSIGIRTAMGTYGRAGLMGAAGMGLGAGMAAMAPVMAVSAAGEQVMQGMQQQQMLNQMLRQNFQFVNRQGGYGFTAGGAGQIGQFMHQQAMTMAAGGEMTTFDELGRLAQGMARMGMAQGVRNAKEFTDRFKEMLKSVKEIAKEMGTSLEEAQNMMSSMRQVGIFRPGQAVSAARAVRMGAAAGGLATSEVTGMMNVGAQMSRMIGGRGAAGAVAGAEAITNIGVAQQMGIISEADIYEATGLTGAAGRRAWAQQGVQNAAQFLRSNFGRRLVASMAGERGQLDPTAVARFMAGGVGTDETMRMAHEGVRRAGGQAGFMRYEGRMRGELLRQFGADLPVMAVRGWLEERGLLVNELRDRDMLGLQKVLQRGGVRVGQVELEQMVRQARELPRIMEERRRAGEEQQWAEDISRKRGMRGVEGLKRQLEQARAHVQGQLQSAGSAFYQEGAEIIERFINRLTDTYVQDHRRDVQEAFRAITRGGPGAEQALRNTFGMERGAGGRLQRVDYGLGLTKAYDITGNAGARNLAEFRRRDLAGYQEAGWGGMFRGVGRWANISMMSPGEVQQGQQNVREVIQTLAGNRDIAGVRVGNVGAQLQESMRNFMSAGTQSRGLDRINAMQKWLSQQGTDEARSLARQIAEAPSAKQKAAVVRAIWNQANISWEDQQRYFKEPTEMGLYNATRFFTEDAMLEDMGRFWTGEETGVTGIAAGAGGAAATSLIVRARQRAGWETPSGAWKSTDYEARARRGAEYIRGEGRDLLAQSIDPRRAAGARDEIRKRLSVALENERNEKDFWGGQKITGEAGGEVFALRRMMLATSFADMRKKDRNLTLDNLSEAQRKKLVKDATDIGFFELGGKDRQYLKNLTPEERERLIMNELKSTVALGVGASEQARTQAYQDQADAISKRLDESVEAGVVRSNAGQLTLSSTFKKGLTTALGDDASAAEEYMQALMDQQVAMKEAYSSPSEESIRKLDDSSRRVNALLGGKSAKQLRAFSQALSMGGSAFTGGAARVSERAGLQKAFGTGSERERLSRFASYLGLDMSKADIGKYLGPKGTGIEGLEATIAGKLGLQGEDQMRSLRQALSGLTAGGKEGAMTAAGVAQTLSETEPVQKRLEARRAEAAAKREEDFSPMGNAIAKAIINQWRAEGTGLPVRTIEQ